MAKKKVTRGAQGTGSVFFENYSGLWVAQVMDGYTDKGRPKYIKARRKGQKEAAEALNDLITKANLGIALTMPKQKVSEYLDHWLKEKIQPHREPKTYRVYEQLTRLYIKPKLGHFVLAKLKAQQIQSAFNQLAQEGGKADEAGKGTPLSPKTVRDAKGVLCSALTSACRDGLIRENPASKILTAKLEQSDAVYLTAHDAATLIESTRPHYIGPLIEIALMTGLRLGEATGLTWDDVDLEARTIRVRRQLQRVGGKLVLKTLKTRSSNRTLSLPDEGIETLKEQQKRQRLAHATHKGPDPYNSMGLVFTSVQGRPLDGTYIDDVLKALCAEAEVQVVSFHKLRHTAATHLAAAGVPLAVVRDQLGHSQIGLTANIYTHAVPAALRQASDTLGSIYGKAKKENEPQPESAIG